jgi:hypothetical protein
MADDLLFKAGLDNEAFNAGIGRMLKSVTGFAAGFLTLGTAADILKDIAKKAEDNEAATIGLASAVKSLKNGTEEGFLALNRYAESMSETTGIAQDELKGALQKLVYETGNTAVAQKSLTTAIDLSKGAHISLEAAAKMVGKAYEGNFTALSRYGIEIAKGTTGMDALAKITDKFGGAEDSYLASVKGRIDKAKNSMALFEAEIGGAFLPAMGDAADAVMKFIHSFTNEGKIEAAKTKLAELSDELKNADFAFKHFTDSQMKMSGYTRADLPDLIKKLTDEIKEQKKVINELGGSWDEAGKKAYRYAKGVGDSDDQENTKQKEKIDMYSHIGKALTDLASLSKTKNKELFEIGKAASIGAIIASTAEAIMKTGAELGYPLAIPFQAMAAVEGGVQIAAASGATFSAARGLFNDTNESMISTFQPQEMVVPSVFSQGIMSGKYSLHGGNSSTETHGDTIIHVNAGNKSIDQTLREVKTYVNNNRGGRLVRTDGSLNV